MAPCTRRAIAAVDTSRFDPDSGRFARAVIAELETLMGDCERRIAEMFRISRR